VQLAEAFQGFASRVDSIPGWDRGLFRIGGTDVTVASLVSFFVFLLLAFLLSAVLQRTLTRLYTRRSIEEGIQYSLNRLLHYLIIAVGGFLALENLGVSLTALAGVGAILAVGIGFGLQNITQNFVSGLILLLERPVKKGDFVEVGDVRGTVRDIRARATIVTTLDNVDILVPNGQLITERVVNQTLDNRSVRTRVNVGVAYGSDTDRVRRVLERVAAEHPDVLDDPPPTVRFTDFGDSSLDFSLLVWVPEALVQGQITSELRFAVDRAFREAGIEIPFPQRDVHVRSGRTPTGPERG
jgi:small-conductance mechanosensitive channel